MALLFLISEIKNRLYFRKRKTVCIFSEIAPRNKNSLHFLELKTKNNLHFSRKKSFAFSQKKNDLHFSGFQIWF